MPDPVAFESRAARIAGAIESKVKKMRAVTPLSLPDRNSPLVKDYVDKIEGTYDVSRARVDTDNAIDLLYIAYNTTPQEEGAIRVKISGIMDKLIVAQGDSERTMGDAMRTADNVVSLLNAAFPDWLDAKEAGAADSIKAFAEKDLRELANDIKAKATAIKVKLLAVAATYDQIIADTAAASQDSEKALGSRLKDQQVIQKEIAEAQADRDQVDSLVKDLQEEARKFEAKARDYESRANTAEQRAFIMQIVKIGAQVLSAAIPPIAMIAGAAATGGTSLIAGAALGAAAPKPSEPAKPDATAEVIKTKTEISEKKKELDLAEKKTAESKEKVEGLRKDLQKAQEADGKPAETDPAKETVTQPGDGQEVKALKERLTTAKTELASDEKKYQTLLGALSGLQASLSALASGLGELSQEQKDQAAGLREAQMRMLDKAEAYEKERREQAAKLVKINALLKGKRTQEETIQLAVKSLNISISALKRTKEIIEEIAFFFKSFADFMEQVGEEANSRLELIDKVAASSTIGKNRLELLVRSTDEFFICQSGEWHAAWLVSETFNASFAGGRKKLNELSGNYITGDQLAAYLQKAAVQLKQIADARQAAAQARLVDLEHYRKILRDDATAVISRPPDPRRVQREVQDARASRCHRSRASSMNRDGETP